MREVASKWAETFDAIADIVTIISPNYEFIDINKAGLAACGKTKEELIGKKCYEVIHGLKEPIAGCPCKETLKTKKAGTGEITDRGRCMYITADPILNDKGELTAFVHTAKDITERKKAEEALREREEIFGSFMENSPIYVFFKDENIRAIRLSRNYETMLGRPIAELLGKNMEELFPSELAMSMVADDMRILKEGNKVNIEEELNGRVYSTVKFPIQIKGKSRYLAGYTIDITERKKSEIALRESEEKFKAIFDNANDGFLVASAKDKKFILGNKAICEMTGYTPEEIKTLGVMDIHSEKDLPYVIDQFEKQAKKEIEVSENLPVKRKDGSIFYADVNASLITLLGETYLIGIFRDITERKKAEEELRESEEKYRTLVESASDWIFMFDEGYKVVSMNCSAAKQFRKNPDELIGKHISEIFPEKIASQNMKNLERVFKTGTYYSIEEEMFFGEHKLYISTNLSPVKDASGKTTAVLGVTRDITERKKAEAEIKGSEERLKILFDHAPDAYYLNDLAGNIADGNQAAEKLLGYKKEELIGKNMLKVHLLPIKEVAKAASLFLKNTMGKSTGPDEFNLKRKDGSLVPVEISTHPVKIGGKTLVLGIARDITTRKKAEETKEKLFMKLEEANRNKTQFVSDVSHELRTPLASIKGFVSTIRSDPAMDEPTRQDFLRIAEEETDRLTRIIEDLLDISRVESGRLKLTMHTFNIIDLIMKNIELLKPQAESREINIKSELPSSKHIVYADEDKTSQVITNLLSNAIKYNKKGGKVVVSAVQENGKLRINVEDTGIGIAEKDLPRMFEKFFRADEAAALAQGTGLGLPVTKGLVESMGGELAFKSKHGEGSNFSFTLPGQKQEVKD